MAHNKPKYIEPFNNIKVAYRHLSCCFRFKELSRVTLADLRSLICCVSDHAKHLKCYVEVILFV